MKMIPFIRGTIVGEMIGGAIICLMQIKRLERQDWEVDNDIHGDNQCRKRSSEK